MRKVNTVVLHTPHVITQTVVTTVYVTLDTRLKGHCVLVSLLHQLLLIVISFSCSGAKTEEAGSNDPRKFTWAGVKNGILTP